MGIPWHYLRAMELTLSLLLIHFERGGNGDPIGGAWLIAQGTPQITTAQSVSGTRSGMLAGGTTYPNAYISPAARNSKALRIQTYGFCNNGPFIQWGNSAGTYLAGFYISTSTIYDRNGNNIGSIGGASSWHVWDLQNMNFTSHTFDLYLDGTLVKSGAAMAAGLLSDLI